MNNYEKPTYAACITAIILFATLMIGVTSCSILQSREQTKRVEAACAGDIANQARATACAVAVILSGKTPQ